MEVKHHQSEELLCREASHSKFTERSAVGGGTRKEEKTINQPPLSPAEIEVATHSDVNDGAGGIGGQGGKVGCSFQGVFM